MKYHVMIWDVIADHDATLRSHELLAEGVGLTGRRKGV